MDEVYTCVCGSQRWSIHDSFIRCANCQKEYKFKYIESGIEVERIEDPSEFNKRVEQVKKDIADDSKTNSGG